MKLLWTILLTLLILQSVICLAQFQISTSFNNYTLDWDNTGNIYVLCKEYPPEVRKYNSLGVLQYTWVKPSLRASNLCDISCNRSTGEIYFSDGGDGTIYLISNSGITQKTISTSNGHHLELWKIFYNSCTNKLVIGTGQDGNGSYEGINIVSPDLSSIQYYTVTNVSYQNDCVLLTLSDDNKIYTLFAENTQKGGNQAYPGSNDLIKLDYSNPSTPVWQVSSGYSFKEISSIQYVTDGTWVYNANQMNGISVDNNFNYVYTTDGRNIKSWNKTTGSLVKKVSTGGSSFQFGGISVDQQGYVYTSLNYVVLKYSGNNLIYQGEVCRAPASSNTIYDVKVGNNLVYYCGKGIIGSCVIDNINSCNTILPVELEYFYGTQVGENIELHWSTLSETNNEFFVISQAYQELDFKPISRLSGAGSTSGTTRYKYSVKSPVMSSYYQLKQVDFDGREKILGTVFVLYNKELKENPFKYHNIIWQELRHE